MRSPARASPRASLESSSRFQSSPLRSCAHTLLTADRSPTSTKGDPRRCPSPMYQASVPAFLQTLNNLSAILDKAEAYAGNRKIDPEVLLNYRLCPDMLSFFCQIQIAADLAKGAAWGT